MSTASKRTEITNLDTLDIDQRSRVMDHMEIALQKVRAMAADRKPRSRPGNKARKQLLKAASSRPTVRSAHRNGQKA